MVCEEVRGLRGYRSSREPLNTSSLPANLSLRKQKRIYANRRREIFCCFATKQRCSVGLTEGIGFVLPRNSREPLNPSRFSANFSLRKQKRICQLRREIFCCKATKRRRSMVCEEVKDCVAFAPRMNPWTPQEFLLTILYANKKGYVKDISFFVAQRKGFEPLYTFLHNTISNRARSTAPPSLQ